MDEQFFKLPLEDGTEQLCKVIITFDAEEFSYVLYAIIDEAGNESEEILALRFELGENGEMTDFAPLETESEWEMVDEVLNTLIAEFNDGEENYFTISDENGEDIICEVLHRFELKQFGKSYIFYSFVDVEEAEIFAAAYTAGENGLVEDLIPIETEEEWNQVEKELEKLNQ